MTRTEKAMLFGQKLQEKMAEKGLSAADIARACGITRESVRRYLQGKRLPCISIIPDLSDCCGVAVEYWFGGRTYD